MADDQLPNGMNPVTVKKVIGLIKTCYRTDTPPYLHGGPGIGKTDAFTQAAKELDINERVVHLNSMLPEDLAGIPVPDLEKRLAVWLKGEYLPILERDGPVGLFVCDEFTDTSKAVQSVTNRLFLNRQIGDYVLPKGWLPCAAGNLREHRASAQALSTATASRFAHFDVYPCPEVSKEHFMKIGMDFRLIAFLSPKMHGPRLLFNMKDSDTRAFPNPRAWVECHKFMNEPAGDRTILIRGKVGPGASAELDAFLKGINIPDLDEVLDRPTTCRIPPEPSCLYAMSAMLAQNMTRKNSAKIGEYVKREEYGADFEIITFLDASKRDPSIVETKAWTDFSTRHGHIML